MKTGNRARLRVERRPRWYGAIAVCLLFLTACSGSATPAGTIALVGGAIFDGTGGEVIPDGVVLVRDGRIAAVGRRSAVEIPPDAEVRDVSGMTVLPGLINTHVHDAYDTATLVAWAQGGVTTVRDLTPRTGDLAAVSALYAFRDAALSDPRCARLVGASPMLCNPDGYGFLALSSPEEAAGTVGRFLDAGADLIKIGIESRQGTRTWPLISQDLVDAIVSAAHARGAYVSAHVSQPAHVEMALDAGVDELAHMAYGFVSDELVARIVAAGIIWVPTLELWHGVGYGRHGVDTNLLRFVRAGGTVALGTDYGGYAIPFDLGTPITEIRLMSGASLTPMEILLSATRNAARACGLADSVGTLETGKVADVLVVEGDPLTDLEALTRVRLVLRAGVVIRDGT